MNLYTAKSPFRIVASFTAAEQAEAARATVTQVLNDARDEVNSLFERQGGMANASDVGRIYARYGFANECGWEQDSPILIKDEALCWFLPEGMLPEEAQSLLAALGAVSLTVENPLDDELIKQVPHPAALILSEVEEDIEDFEETEHSGPGFHEKKTLH